MIDKCVTLLLAILLVLSLAACGRKNVSEPALPAAEEQTIPGDSPAPSNALEEILAQGELHVAMCPDFAPMEFVDSSRTGQQQFEGFDVLLAQYIARELGVELVIEAMDFDVCQNAVFTGSVPMSISGYAFTEQRAVDYELSDYYYPGENGTQQVLLLREADAAAYTRAEDFCGANVGVQVASLQMQLLAEQLPDANPVTVDDITVGVMELMNGNLRALAVAGGNAAMIRDAYPGLVVCSWQFAVEEAEKANVIMLQKGEAELLEKVNEILAKAYAEGLYGGWYDAAVEQARSVNEARASRS